MAFLNQNPNDDNNGFGFEIRNEIYTDEEHPFQSVNGLTYDELLARRDSDDVEAGLAISRFEEYPLTIVLLSDTELPEEFNLQFTRLNLGAIVNAGEKLNAMIGQMRDLCFDNAKIGKHPFLEIVRIPTRRFAKELVAAQVLIQVFAKNQTGSFVRARHYDLQKFFKNHKEIGADEAQWVDAVEKIFDALKTTFDPESHPLRNRAITVSTVLLAWANDLHNKTDLRDAFAEFLRQFLSRLSWQVGLGFDMDAEYRYLNDFQRHVTQASVEKPAIEARAQTLQAEFDHWRNDGALEGDCDYLKRENKDPRDLFYETCLNRTLETCSDGSVL